MSRRRTGLRAAAQSSAALSPVAKPSFALSSAALLSILAIACSSPAKHPERDRSQVVSIASPSLRLQRGAGVAWMPGSGVTGDGAESREIEGYLRSSIRSELNELGLRAVSPSESGLQIGFLAAETEALDPQAIATRFGIHTGDWTGDPELPTGTLLVLLVDRGSGRTVWRASVQIPIVRDLPPGERSERLAHHVGRLFDSLPMPAAR